jgi:hypothetical protein
MSASLRQLS